MYVIGGYNEKEGVLNSCEKLCLKTYRFTRLTSLNQERLNSSSTCIDSKYIYAFGGVGEQGSLDSIEKYNIKYNIWETLSIKLPFKVHNGFSIGLSSKEVLLLGGKKPQKNGEDETITQVYLFNTSKGTMKELPKLSFNTKISTISYNNEGKIH